MIAYTRNYSKVGQTTYQVAVSNWSPEDEFSEPHYEDVEEFATLDEALKAARTAMRAIPERHTPGGTIRKGTYEESILSDESETVYDVDWVEDDVQWDLYFDQGGKIRVDKSEW